MSLPAPNGGSTFFGSLTPPGEALRTLSRSLLQSFRKTFSSSLPEHAVTVPHPPGYAQKRFRCGASPAGVRV